MFPDKQYSGRLHWHPQGALKDLFVDSHILQHDSKHSEPAAVPAAAAAAAQSTGSQLSQPAASSTPLHNDHMVAPYRQLLTDGDNSLPASNTAPTSPPVPAVTSPAPPDAQDTGLNVSHLFTVSKPPGRLTTKPTIGLDPSDATAKEELRRRSRSLLLSDKVTDMLEAPKIWAQGFSGQHVKVGVHMFVLQRIIGQDRMETVCSTLHGALLCCVHAGGESCSCTCCWVRQEHWEIGIHSMGHCTATDSLAYCTATQ